MKLLYIGDNSDSLNLGCRATSIALRQLAEQHAELIGPVPTRMIQARWPVSDRIGDAAYGQLAKLFNRNKVRALPLAGPAIGAVMDALGTRDAITHDLARNADALMRAQAYSADARALVLWLEECDGALVNGEGDLIFGTPARQRLLFILTLCDMLQQRGKTLFYLNAMASPAPGQDPDAETLAVADEVLARADAFALRDPVSLDFARQHLPRAGAKAAMFPDAVFAWAEDLNSEEFLRQREVVQRFLADHGVDPAAGYILVGGSSRAAHDKPRAAAAFPGLVAALRECGLPVVLQPACNGDSFLEAVARETGAPLFPIASPIRAHVALLGEASLYVSGRWHPSIMAALGGTPCVFMGSNSHKMIALQHQLGYADPHEYDPWPSAADSAAMAAEASELLARGAALRRSIRQRAAVLGAEARKSVAALQTG